jgi:acetyl esterase/lipase
MIVNIFDPFTRLKVSARLNSRVILYPLLITLCLSGCSKKPELLKNNNPDKYTVVKDLLWASPDAFDLTMDIYTPTSGKDSYPVVIIFHGGGWLINDKSIMDQMSTYLVTNGEYVVCNVNYRLLADNDNTVTLNQIVNDAFGAVLWVKHNIGDYKGDSNRIAVTGDSAGAQMTAMIVNMGTHLSSTAYTATATGFNPSWLPAGNTAEQVAENNGVDIQAAVLSYGSYDIYQASLNGFEGMKNPFWLMAGSLPRGIFGDKFNPKDNPELYKGVSPIFNIPRSSERKLPPQLITAGSDDRLITPASVKAYIEKLKAAGQSAEYWEHQNRGHAYLDSGSNAFTGSSFEQDAPQALDVIIEFLNRVFHH